MKRLLTIVALLSGLAACEPRETFVLLPNESGGPGAIVVSGGGGAETLVTPWNALGVSERGAAPRGLFGVDTSTVARDFSAALAQQPLPPQTVTLYFESGTVDLTEESRYRIVDAVLAILDRKSPDVSVVGHADRAGDLETNLELSMRRAKAVADLLVGMGIDASLLEVDSHGENNPVVATADDVAEPRNRRVEITVR